MYHGCLRSYSSGNPVVSPLGRTCAAQIVVSVPQLVSCDILDQFVRNAFYDWYAVPSIVGIKM